MSLLPSRAIVVLLCLAGCGADDPKGGAEVGKPKTVFTEPGSGDENVEPLWPLVVGARRAHQDGSIVSIPERTQKFGKELYRFQGASTVRFYERTEEGVFSAGSMNLGALPRAVLLVPAKVKLGMKWQSFTDGELPSITSTVTSVEIADTIFGPRRVWTISQFDEVGMATYVTKFAEGRGPIEADGNVAVSSVLPLDAAPTLKTNVRLPLTALNAGAPLFTNFWATTASAVVDAAGKATIRVGGQMAWYMNTSGFGSFVLAPQTGCATTADGTALTAGMTWADTGAGSGATSPLCPEASGALWKDGALEQIDVRADGTSAGGKTGLHLLGNGMTEAFTIGVDQYNASVWYLGGTPQGYGTDARVYGAELWRAWVGAGPAQRVLVDSIEPSDDFGFAAMFGDRLLGGSVVGTRISPLRLVAGLPGAHLSTKLTPAGREHYMVTADGVVDRVRIGAGGDVTLERYAELELPAKHELVGVIPFSDHLLVLALANRAEWRAGSTSEPKLGDVLAFSAPLPTVPEAGTSRSDLPQNAITTEILGLDLKVCWPKAAGAAMTSGWTLGGVAVSAIPSGADGSCVVLVRGKAAMQPMLSVGAFAAEGPIPGVGRVAIGLALPDTDPTLPLGKTEWLAPLKSGGFTSVALHFGAGADVIGVPDSPTPVEASSLLNRVPDAAGNGVWWPNATHTSRLCGGMEPAAVLTGETSRCIKAPAAGSITGVIGGGGAIWTAGSKKYLLFVDGTSSEVTGLTPGQVVSGALADGTVCGTEITGTSGGYAYAIFCAKGGLVTTAPSDDATLVKLYGSWVPASAGFYALSTAAQAVYVDPATKTATPIDVSALEASMHGNALTTRIGSDGKLFAMVSNGTTSHLLSIEGTTMKVIDPAGFAAVAPTIKDFLVTNELIVAFTGQATAGGVVRFSRK